VGVVVSTLAVATEYLAWLEKKGPKMREVGLYPHHPVDGGRIAFGPGDEAKGAEEFKDARERKHAERTSTVEGPKTPTVEGLKEQIKGIQKTIHDLRSEIDRLKQKLSTMSSAGHRPERHHQRAHHGAAARSGLTKEIGRRESIIQLLEQKIVELNKQIEMLPRDGAKKPAEISDPIYTRSRYYG
jgi:predicted RNase H-like nuclease (RuvC/YqgF family)